MLVLTAFLDDMLNRHMLDDSILHRYYFSHILRLQACVAIHVHPRGQKYGHRCRKHSNFVTLER